MYVIANVCNAFDHSGKKIHEVENLSNPIGIALDPRSVVEGSHKGSVVEG